MQKSGSPAVRWGLIFGGIIAVLGLLGDGLRFGTGGGESFAGGGGGIGILVSVLLFVIGLALFFVAGMFAARDSGRTGTGSIAGLIAGLIGGAIGAIATIIILLTLPPSVFQTVTANRPNANISGDQLRTIVLVGGVIAAIFGLLINAGIGAGVGALGGLVGKGQYRGPMRSYQEAMYQGMPMQPGAYPPPPPPGYPQYPQPGGYPQYPQYPPQQPGAYPPPPPPQYPGPQQ
jgi:hypothetical protein